MTLPRISDTRLSSVAMACNVSQDLEHAVRVRADAEGLTMPEAQRAALRAWTDDRQAGARTDGAWPADVASDFTAALPRDEDLL